MVKKGQSGQSSASTSEFTELKRDNEDKVAFNMQTSLLTSGKCSIRYIFCIFNFTAVLQILSLVLFRKIFKPKQRRRFDRQA